MSSDIVVCPQCGTNLQNSAGIAGQVVACPQCQTRLQMPAMPQPAAMPELPPNALPPAIDSMLPAPVGMDASSSSPSPGPIVRPKRSKGGATASVRDRLRKRSNPWVIVFAVVMVIVLVAVGIVAHQANQAYAEREEFKRQMIGNWELVPGQSELERWDFAFHSDGKMQMALGTQLNEGRWRVTSVRGSTGDVLIEWPDDAPQTLHVQLIGGTLQIALEGVGNFAFRAAAP